MLVQLKQGSLTDGDEAVLVNASNTGARLGSGVSHAIRIGCGPRFQDQIYDELVAQRGGEMVPGDLFVTHAGEHPRASHVVHAAVMDYRAGASFQDATPDEARIRAICEKLWPAIAALGLEDTSVAMVALGAGTGGLGVAMPTQIACETLARAERKPDRVCFYAWMLHEYMSMREVVTEAFSDAEIFAPAEA